VTITAPWTRPVRDIVELDRAECLRLLAATRFGRLAVATSEGTPAIRPLNYVFDDSSQSVVFRTAPGSKLSALLTAEKAAFEIDGVDHGTGTGWSVIVSGVAEQIIMRGEIERLDARGLESWVPAPEYVWIRIRAFTVSGRRIVLAPA
jgi:nitroimidazol reductase NimA-like FMN-containing flavoprotein (pyridoxamine 5'-phosphate oxidase superfamily)